MAEIHFEEWKEQEAEAFQTFQSNEDRAFMNYLKVWRWYQEERSPDIYSKPKPAIQPIKKPFLSETVKPLVQALPTVVPLVYAVGSKCIEVEFFGDILNFSYPETMNKSLGKASIQGISDFWREVTHENYRMLVQRIKHYQKVYQLNGWGIYLLIERISQQLTKEGNKERLLQWFLLLKMNIDAKVGISQGEVVLMVHSQHLIHATRYFRLDQKRYFVLDSSLPTDKLQIYKGGSYNLLALDFMKQPLFQKNIKKRNIEFTFKSRGYKLSFYYNKNLTDFYKTYPQIPYNHYTTMNLSSQSIEVFNKILKPIVQQMNQVDSINFLLRLTQNGFKYKRDHAQFGKEKVMFFEESLAYVYNDCEDRAIFFTHLIKMLLQNEIILIQFPNHLATAIAIDSNVQGESVLYKGKKFYIADPTYSGSNIGQAMPQLQGQKIKIIKP